jgi:hypothetical protein
VKRWIPSVRVTTRLVGKLAKVIGIVAREMYVTIVFGKICQSSIVRAIVTIVIQRPIPGIVAKSAPTGNTSPITIFAGVICSQ